MQSNYLIINLIDENFTISSELEQSLFFSRFVYCLIPFHTLTYDGDRI